MKEKRPLRDINRNRLLLEAIRDEYRTYSDLREKLERCYRQRCELCGHPNHGVDFDREWCGHKHLCTGCTWRIKEQERTSFRFGLKHDITIHDLKLTKGNIYYLVKAYNIPLTGSITEFCKLLDFLVLVNRCCLPFRRKYMRPR